MKNKIFMLLIILILMIILPIYLTENLSFLNFYDTKLQQENEEKKVIQGLVASKFKPEYNTETLKAMALILKWNYKTDPDKAYKDFMSEDDFIKKYNKDYYDNIKKAVNEVYEHSMELNSKEYIPINYITTKNSKTDAIKNYANPWDLLTKEYDSNKEITGISLNTLNNLCKNGLNFENALSYFFKDIKITP